jgi:ribonuclease HI
MNAHLRRLSVWYKANWDAVGGEKSGRTGFGVVIGDSNGVLLSARRGTRRGCLESSLAEAEAEAVLMSIQLCRDLGLSRIVFEGDAKGVVDGINSAEVNRGWMVQVMANIKVEIQVVEDWKVQYDPTSLFLSFLIKQFDLFLQGLDYLLKNSDFEETKGGSGRVAFVVALPTCCPSRPLGRNWSFLERMFVRLFWFQELYWGSNFYSFLIG